MEAKKIQCIQFGLLSPEEIAGMAVCEIKNNYNENNNRLDEVINELRMGPINNLSICKTCNQNYDNCPGHFGFIKLNKPVFHIEYISECVNILNCICYNCHRILINDYEKYEQLLKIINPEERILKTYNHCINIDKCKERRNQKGKNVEIYYKPGCGYKKPIFKQQNLKIIMEYKENSIIKEKIIQPEQIKNDRDDVRNNMLTGNDNNIYIPVNINKIVNIAKNEFKINNYTKSDLNPLYVIGKLKELKESLKLIKVDDIISKQIQECSMILFNKVLNYSLSTKNIIFKHRLSKKAFDFVYNEIKTKFEQAIVKPGEMVGAIAAQSISESASHLINFNILFNPIIFKKNLKRLTEIIKVKKELEAPYMKICIKEKGNNAINTIFKVKNEIECIKPDKMINLSEIYYDPDITHSIIEEDQELIDEYCEIMFGNDINNIIPYISPWVLRFELDRYIFREDYYTMEQKIKKYLTKGKIIFIQSPPYIEKKIILIRLMADSSMNENEKKEILSFKYLKNLEKKILNSESLSGIENIKKVYHSIRYITKYDNLGRLIHNNIENILETEGSNLSKIFELEEIDFKRTITNNVHEIYNILGIEAARIIILNELKELFKLNCIYINQRHFSILCDI
jgi:DNA-directed RNA polymerase II subunit RPB1